MKKKLETLAQNVKEKKKEHQAFLNRIKRKKPKKLDVIMREEHENVFENIDCLECANCCKTTGPLFITKDIERISRYLRLKPQKFIENYLQIDQDNDYVLQSVPCPFLGDDNYCSIYEVRPRACKEFPHTDRRKFYQINNLTLENIKICPAVYEIIEKVKERI